VSDLPCLCVQGLLLIAPTLRNVPSPGGDAQRQAPRCHLVLKSPCLDLNPDAPSHLARYHNHRWKRPASLWKRPADLSFRARTRSSIDIGGYVNVNFANRQHSNIGVGTQPSKKSTSIKTLNVEGRRNASCVLRSALPSYISRLPKLNAIPCPRTPWNK